MVPVRRYRSRGAAAGAKPGWGHDAGGAGRWRRCVRGKVGSVAGADLVTSLQQAGVGRGDLVALVISPTFELGLAAGDSSWTVPGAAAEGGPAAEVRRADEELRPRWVLWSGQTAARL